jgi:hypothetical protein
VDTGTDKNNLDWLSPDVLIEFIDELREVGYKIGISQYITAQDLILMLIAQGEIFDSPEDLRNLLGPIFCSSPTEQEEFQEHFDRWVQLYSRINLSKGEVDVEAETLSAELETERALSSEIQGLIFFIAILIFLSILLFPSQIENKSVIKPLPIPTKSPTSIFPPPIQPETLPTVPPRQLNPKPIAKSSKNSRFNWQILLQILLILLTVCVHW